MVFWYCEPATKRSSRGDKSLGAKRQTDIVSDLRMSERHDMSFIFHNHQDHQRQSELGIYRRE